MEELDLKEEIRVMSKVRWATPGFNKTESREVDTSPRPRVIGLNVRGRIFDVSSETLSIDKGSLLFTRLVLGNGQLHPIHDSEGRIFVDSDPICFGKMINCREHLPPNTPVERMPLSTRTFVTPIPSHAIMKPCCEST